MQSYNVFDFLKEVVSKVPDYTHSEAGGDDANITKRRYLLYFLLCKLKIFMRLLLIFLASVVILGYLEISLYNLCATNECNFNYVLPGK